MPEVRPIISLNKWCEETSSSAKLILDTEGSDRVDSIADSLENVAILVGPEGGFEEEEISMAVQCGFKRVRLGPRVLRAETAPLVALSILQSVYGDVP